MFCAESNQAENEASLSLMATEMLIPEHFCGKELSPIVLFFWSIFAPVCILFVIIFKLHFE